VARGSSTAAYAQMVAGGQQIAARVDLLSSGVVWASTDPSVADTPIRVTDGKWSMDETRDTLTECDITLLAGATDLGLIPATSSSSLSPVSDTEFQLWSGFQIPDTGLADVESIGVFGFNTNNITQAEGGVAMELQGFDRSTHLQRARFVTPYTILKNTNYVTAITTLVQATIPYAPVLSTPTYYKTPLLTFDADTDTTYKDAVDKLADAIGYVVYFDSLGRCVIEPAGDSNADPQWTFGVGSDTRIVADRRSLSNEKTYNGVIFRGESPGSDRPPVQGVAWDTDPSSPTYYDPANPGASRYGPVPYFEASEFITSASQATAAAVARLPKVRGLVEQMVLDTRFNPYIEARDVVQIDNPTIGASGLYVVESVSGSIQAGNMHVTTRERRI
jgi:hypothetical protein